jgi:hypothetical protein
LSLITTSIPASLKISPGFWWIESLQKETEAASIFAMIALISCVICIGQANSLLLH